jgi:hypothetical protein
MTNYQYLRSLGLYQFAAYLQSKLAGNLGCPPVHIIDAYDQRHCADTNSGSCERCWVDWLKQERAKDWTDDPKTKVETVRCKDCGYGVRGDNGDPFIVCRLPMFYGAIMRPDDFCSNSVPMPVPAAERRRREHEWRIRKWELDRMEEDSALASGDAGGLGL